MDVIYKNVHQRIRERVKQWEAGYLKKHGEEWLEYRKPNSDTTIAAWEQIRILIQFKFDGVPPENASPDEMDLLVEELDKRYPE
jgi:hypothetical protein